MIKGFPGNLQDMFQQAQELQSKVVEMKEEAEKKEVQASAGGGMVRVTVNGAQQLMSLSIDKTVVNPDDVEMLQDLVRAAVNEGMKKSKEILKEEISKLTGGIPIPGFNL